MPAREVRRTHRAAAGLRFDRQVAHAAEQWTRRRPLPGAELDGEGATRHELRFVSGAPCGNLPARWFRHHAVSLGAARVAGHNDGVRIR